MPDRKTVLECVHCRRQFTGEEDAQKCEDWHVRIDDLVIISAGFDSTLRYGPDRIRSKIPNKIRVSWGLRSSEHAMYVLERIGPRGV